MSALFLLAAATLIPRELFFSNPQYASPKISPDAQYISWLAPDGRGVRNVWVRPRQGGEPRLVTRDPNRGITNYLWRPDSRHILYFQDQNGNEDFHLFETGLDGSGTRDLTPLPGIRAEFLALGQTEMLLLMNQREGRHFEVYRLDLSTGGLKLDTPNPGNFVFWLADRNLQVRAAIAYLPDGTQQVQVRDTTRSPWRVIETWGPHEVLGRLIAFRPDGQALWLLSSVGANTSQLVEIDLTSSFRKILASDSQYDISDVLLSPTTGQIQSIATLRGSPKSVSPKSGPVPDIGVILSRDATDRYWIFAKYSPSRPPQYLLYDRTTRQKTTLSDSHPDLPNRGQAPIREVAIRARDGLVLHGYMARAKRTQLPAPTVLLVHGGPWVRDTLTYSPTVQFLANRGYVVLQVNYRGSSGYGKQFLNAGNREWGGKMLDDLVDAKRWAVRQGYAKPDKVGIMGASFGGYLTLAGLAFTPTEFACGVDMVGQSNLLTFLRTIPSFATSVRALYDLRVGNPDRDEAMLRARSPYYHVDRIVRPLLIIQGANDPRVPRTESDQMVEALRARNKPVEYMLLPDEGHNFSIPANQIRVMGAIEKFLAKHLGGHALD
ncbi:MAG: S9 family peptidase [Bryobacterales bacterium]|nr:S9 family peptidase [Bryobacterales bacterium]